MGRITGLLLALAITVSTVRADEPAAVTKTAYQTAMAHFGFTPDTVQRERPYLTPDLYAALIKKANQPVAKGDAPDIEGDVFLNAQDVPDKFEVGKASVDGLKADVPVSLRWGTEKRRYVVHLVQLKGGWKIADVDYGKDGKLTDLLK
jgi:hypothetical protein